MIISLLFFVLSEPDLFLFPYLSYHIYFIADKIYFCASFLVHFYEIFRPCGISFFSFLITTDRWSDSVLSSIVKFDASLFSIFFPRSFHLIGSSINTFSTNREDLRVW